MENSSNNTDNADAFAIVNKGAAAQELDITIYGTRTRTFKAFRTGGAEKYAAAGTFKAPKAPFRYKAPPRSVTTFFGSPLNKN